ncbi:MAG: argininosuccinate lyase [Planctomycetota bacterium]|nr:argininosuccinate lyase [Planctomycetota bacterium]
MAARKKKARASKGATTRGAKKGGAKRAKKAPKDLLRGRFGGGVHPALDRINRSFGVDARMWPEDIAGSIAHATMLGAQGIVTKAAAKRMVNGLMKVAEEFAEGRFDPRPSDEDIHMAVERRLTELIGPDGARLHTGRSRNDQVATDVRLYLHSASSSMELRVREVQRALLALAQRDGQNILPFYTHLQRAQPVLLGHVLLAYVEMLERDNEQARYELTECPLGSGAGAGTSLPIDRRMTARLLGFKRPAPNSLEAVSSRADVGRLLAGFAALAVTLSRLGGDLVLWTSREFAFARLGDAVSTGSSIMPQKRNPDGAELLRAKAVSVGSAHARMLELQRGLPLGYFKDLQEDKRFLFEAEDELESMCDVAVAMLGDIAFDAARMRATVEEPLGFMLATEAADFLVRRDVPFREAHEAVGGLVRTAEGAGIGLEALTLKQFQAAHPRFDAEVFGVLTADGAVAARRAVGGPSPANVRRQIAHWAKRLA